MNQNIINVFFRELDVFYIYISELFDYCVQRIFNV